MPTVWSTSWRYKRENALAASLETATAAQTGYSSPTPPTCRTTRALLDEDGFVDGD
jgi:hypothetical protein